MAGKLKNSCRFQVFLSKAIKGLFVLAKNSTFRLFLAAEGGCAPFLR